VPSTLTVASVYEHVRSMLGEPVVDVEVLESHYEAALRQAVRVYNRYLPREAVAPLTVSSAVKKYLVSHVNLLGVTDVQFVRDVPVTGSVDPFTYWRRSDQFVGGMSFGELDQQFHSAEDASRILSVDPDWKGQWEQDGSYYLYISVPEGRTFLCSYTYLWAVSPDDTAGTGLSAIPETDTDWLLDFTTARVKQVLGRVLRKHGGVPMPDGGSESTDGSDLSQEGREDEQRLTDEIRRRSRRPLLDVG